MLSEISTVTNLCGYSTICSRKCHIVLYCLSVVFKGLHNPLWNLIAFTTGFYLFKRLVRWVNSFPTWSWLLCKTSVFSSHVLDSSHLYYDLTPRCKPKTFIQRFAFLPFEQKFLLTLCKYYFRITHSSPFSDISKHLRDIFASFRRSEQHDVTRK